MREIERKKEKKNNVSLGILSTAFFNVAVMCVHMCGVSGVGYGGQGEGGNEKRSRKDNDFKTKTFGFNIQNEVSFTCSLCHIHHHQQLEDEVP